MEGPPPTPRENIVRLRAKRMLGSGVDILPRTVLTRAGPGLTGVLVYGYLVVRTVTDPDRAPGREVLGVSPPLGSNLDLGWLGTPEEALADALARKADRLGPHAEEDIARDAPRLLKGGDRRTSETRPHWQVSTAGTTSSIELPAC